MRKKPASVEDTGELLLWMKDMIENQHKDIAELRDAVKQSVANGGGMGATSMMANGMSPVSTAHVDDTPQSRESLIEFIHRNPVFAGATGINPEEKENFIEMIAGNYTSNPHHNWICRGCFLRDCLWLQGALSAGSTTKTP